MDAMYLVVRRSLHAGDTSYLTTERFRDGTGKLCALWSPMREHAKEYKTERAAHKAAVQYDGAVMKFSVLEDIARELLAALKQAREDTCSLHCPSVYKTGEIPRHSDVCKAISAIVAEAERELQ